MEKYKKRAGLLIIIVVMCVLASVSAMAIRNTSKGKIAELLNIGSKYLAELDFEQAVVSYQAVIEIDPKCEEAYMGITEAYLQMGEYDKAAEYAIQGYSQTGAESLREKAELIQTLEETVKRENAEAGSPDDIPENDNSQSVLDEEVFGECIVDGIYHHGYSEYEIADEEEAFFDTLISYTEAGRYEECAELLKEGQCEEFCDKYRDLTGYASSICMSYKGYKIGIRRFNAVWLIPEDDGMGALYSFSQTPASLGDWDEESIRYTFCECTDGMYNGSFVSHVKTRLQKYDHVAEVVVEGEVVNGLINSRVTTHYNNPPYKVENGQRYYYGVFTDTGSYYSVFSGGKVQKVEYETTKDTDGTTRVRALINFYEDDTPVLEGTWLYQEDVEEGIGVLSEYGDGYILSSPIEREDGAYEIYPY